MEWPTFLTETSFLGNDLLRWSSALAVTLIGFLVLRVLLAWIRARLRSFSGRTTTRVDDVVADALDKTKILLLLVVAVWMGSLLLELPERWVAIVRGVARVALILQAGFWASVFLVFGIKSYVARRLENDAASATSVTALGFLAKVVLWALVLVLALQNLGIEVTALVAGLGVSGIAVALASQHILGDLFASFVILLDKPFVIGDFIIVGDFLGSVEYVGLKTTRVRSLSGEQVVFSNTDLLASRVRNFKRMAERRVLFTIGVTYQTSHEHLREIPGLVREIIESQERVRFDRSHFKGFGDFALVFEIVYYVLSSDYAAYMDVQEQINLELHRRFTEKGIDFAYPTQTLWLQREEPVPAGTPAE